jgi:hypothetical protein
VSLQHAGEILQRRRGSVGIGGELGGRIQRRGDGRDGGFAQRLRTRRFW